MLTLRYLWWRFVVWWKYTELLVPDEFRRFDRLRQHAPPDPRDAG